MVFTPSDSLSYLIPKQWEVDEKITTAWAKANLDSTLFGLPLRGNFGLQAQHVDQSSKSAYWDGAANKALPIEDGKTYTDILPSANLIFDLSNDQVVRVGLAKQVARPRMDELNAGLNYGVSSAGVPGGSGGNPKLDPWRANAFDISWEKYFGTKAYIAAAFYYKQLKSYIYTQSQTVDFSKENAGVTVAPFPLTPYGQYSAPFNGQGGKMQGIELTASLPLENITPILRGFGVVASANYNDSSITIYDPNSATSVGNGPITLPGLSKNVYNLTAYYEHGGFEARISQRRRSDFIGEISNFSASRTLRYVVGENITDAQIGYNFGDGSLKGLSLLFQVNNLTDASYQTYAGTKDRPLEYIKWGRTYLVGANYKF
jgi:TonB-dependent receptor